MDLGFSRQRGPKMEIISWARLTVAECAKMRPIGTTKST
jgi:hypothetical protein